MSVTVIVTIQAKPETYEEFVTLAKEELAFTRSSQGCHAVHVSTEADSHVLKLVQFWESKDLFMQYFEKRVERSGEVFEKALMGMPVMEFYDTLDWGYGAEYNGS